MILTSILPTQGIRPTPSVGLQREDILHPAIQIQATLGAGTRTEVQTPAIWEEVIQAGVIPQGTPIQADAQIHPAVVQIQAIQAEGRTQVAVNSVPLVKNPTKTPLVIKGVSLYIKKYLPYTALRGWHSEI